MTGNRAMLRCQRRCDRRGPARPGATRRGPARRDPRHAGRYEIVINGGAATAPRNCIFTRIGTTGGPRRSAQFAAANRPSSEEAAARYQEIGHHLGKHGGIAS